MTYAVQPDIFQYGVRHALRHIGKDYAAEVLGVTPQRLEQLSNPARRDLRVLDMAVALDVECARRGGGTPLYDLYSKKLDRDNVLNGAGMRYHALVRVVANVVQILRSAADALAEAIDFVPDQAAYGRG
jgi:hypothetical protein